MSREARSQKSREAVRIDRPSLFALRSTLSWVALALLVAACVPSGVADLSATGGKLALINSNDLYVISEGEQEIDFYTFFPDARYRPALAPDGSAIAYVDRGGRLTYQPLNGDKPRVLIPQQIGRPGPGLLTFLPNGQLLLFDAGSTFDRYIRVFDVKNGQTTLWLTGINQVFFSAAAVETKASSSQLTTYAAGRIDASRLQQFNFVLAPTTCLTVEKTCFYSYSADANGSKDNGLLPRVYDTDAQIFFSRRIDDDVTSGLLTPDGKHILLRLRSIVSPDSAQNLYLIDLTSNDPPVPLVENAFGRPDYAVSPDGRMIAYEQTINGVAFVRIYNVLTGERTDLGPGTFDPQWWR
ncbi:MAG: WD40 repeat domain-containing protein [Chloroflexota bacterium]